MIVIVGLQVLLRLMVLILLELIVSLVDEKCFPLSELNDSAFILLRIHILLQIHLGENKQLLLDNIEDYNCTIVHNFVPPLVVCSAVKVR